MAIFLSHHPRRRKQSLDDNNNILYPFQVGYYNIGKRGYHCPRTDLSVGQKEKSFNATKAREASEKTLSLFDTTTKRVKTSQYNVILFKPPSTFCRWEPRNIAKRANVLQSLINYGCFEKAKKLVHSSIHFFKPLFPGSAEPL